MSGAQGWSNLLFLPAEVPGAITFFIAMSILVGFVFFPLSFLLGFAERKLVADLQARVGPNRSGNHGILQGFADLMKELARTSFQIPGKREKFWYLIFVVSLYSTLGALPFGADLIVIESELSALLPLFSLTVASLAYLLMGLESSHYDGVLIALRRGYQHLSAFLPALISVLAVGVVAESLDWRHIAEIQQAGIIESMVIRQPLLILSFASFQLSGMVMLGVAPFQNFRNGRNPFPHDQGLGTFHEFFSFFSWCILSAVLFLGGWEVFGMEESGPFRSLLGLSTLLLKSGILYLGSKVIAKALPQLRLDQMTDFAWKVLSPLSIFTFILCALFKTLGASG